MLLLLSVVSVATQPYVLREKCGSDGYRRETEFSSNIVCAWSNECLNWLFHSVILLDNMWNDRMFCALRVFSETKKRTILLTVEQK